MIVLFAFLLIENILEQYIPFLNYTDELVAIVCFCGIFFSRRKLVVNRFEKRILISLILIIIMGLIGNVLFNYQTSVLAIIKDMLALAKLYLIYLYCTLRQRHGISPKSLKRIELISRYYCILLAFFGIVSQFINLGMTNERSILGLKAFVFLYSHETFMVSSVVIMLTVLLSCGIRKNVIGILAGVIVLFLSMRSKALVFVIMAVVLYLLFYGRETIVAFVKKHKVKIITVVILGIGIVLYFTHGKIEAYLSYGMSAARPALYIVAIRILRDCFPFGAGFATFASHLSISYGSPLYRLYGIANVSGLSKYDNYAYVSDTYWPYIIAQFGILGAAIYIYSLLCIFKNTITICMNKKNTLISAVALFAYVIAACFVESYLTNSTVVLFAITLGLILNQDKEIK